ncbi:MAG TPA: hypothetical protein VHF89_19065 [Solirubrobacteraceae bacterium]|nr:hypothetical protein [Solirubrobacteraceae bacterium]
MRELADGLWVVEVPLRGFGVEVGRRMTVVRLDGDALLLHSPAPLTGEVRASLLGAGRPRFVVAPSLVHGHRFMEDYRAVFDGVELLAAPGLDRRRKDLAFDGVLGSVPDPRWGAHLDQEVFLGSWVPEVVFLHRASGTLVVGDLAIGVDPAAVTSPLARAAWRAEGVHGRIAMPRSFRLVTRNRRAARASLRRILAWEFDRLVLGHGPVVESGGRAAFERAVRPLL